MRLRHLFGVVIGTLSLLILRAGYEAMFPTGDEAGLVAIALFGVVVAAVCVGLPLGLLALTMLLPTGSACDGRCSSSPPSRARFPGSSPCRRWETSSPIWR